MADLVLSVEPERALVDVPRRIVLAGAAPGERVLLEAVTMRAGHPWRAAATFVADPGGVVDPAAQAPVDGDYAGIQPMGLITAQTGSGDIFNPDPAEPLETAITAHLPGREASARLVQDLVAEGVRRVDLREDGLVGVLYLPAATEPAPAIMILNGSGGGVNAPRAALWASRGVAALALGYFGAPGLPRYISNTPLEYFEHALDWLRRTARPKDGFVAVSGQSRGGELALLLGATYPSLVSAVIGYVPSAFVHGGQAAADPAFGRDGPCWLKDGEPLAHIWTGNRAATWKPYDEAPGPRRNAAAMLTALGDPEATARARIPVERIRGPVMLISAGDDGAWPSDLYSLIVRNSLAAAGHPAEICWVNYPQAGHSILFPYLPATRTVHRNATTGVETTTGGTPRATAAASEASWQAVQAFLARATKEPA